MFVPGSSGFYDPASDVTFQGGLPQFDVPILPVVVPQSSGMGLTGILLLAAAGGFAYWYFVYRKKGL